MVMMHFRADNVTASINTLCQRNVDANAISSVRTEITCDDCLSRLCRSRAEFRRLKFLIKSKQR